MWIWIILIIQWCFVSKVYSIIKWTILRDICFIWNFFIKRDNSIFFNYLISLKMFNQGKSWRIFFYFILIWKVIIKLFFDISTIKKLWSITGEANNCCDNKSLIIFCKYMKMEFIIEDIESHNIYSVIYLWLKKKP